MARAKATKPKTSAVKKGLPALATPGDPLVMADGTLIQEEAEVGSIAEEIKNNGKLNPRTFRASKRRALKDLPTTGKTMSGIACVIVYTVLGVGDREIADTLGITPAQLKAVKNHASYPESFNLVVAELINANSDILTARLAAYAGTAVDNIMDIAQTGKKEETKLRANQDIADRGGISPRDMQQRNGNNQGDTLRIQIIKKDEGVDEIKVGFDAAM